MNPPDAQLLVYVSFLLVPLAIFAIAGCHDYMKSRRRRRREGHDDILDILPSAYRRGDVPRTSVTAAGGAATVDDEINEIVREALESPEGIQIMSRLSRFDQVHNSHNSMDSHASGRPRSSRLNAAAEVSKWFYLVVLEYLINFSLVLEKEHLVQRLGECDKNNENSAESEMRENQHRSCNDCRSHTDSLNDIETGPLEFQHTHIVVPKPGQNNEQSSVNTNTTKLDENNNKDDSIREVPAFCAICLKQYQLSDEVSWSSNSQCTHVFHQDCIAHWMVTLLKKRGNGLFTIRRGANDRIIGELDCPMCRQEFIPLIHLDL